MHCGKYIELNPVRAGIVRLPEEYVFSSYRHYACGQPDAVVSDSSVYLSLADYGAGRRQRYVEFVVDSCIINSSRLTSQAFIGSKDFVSKFRQYYDIKEIKSKGGRPRKSKP